jgi:outer membrane protein OmpA-like peptidoglycan-associated protein
MKQLYKSALPLMIVLWASFASLQAQSVRKESWEIGAGIGSTNYYGDLSNYRINNLKDIYKIYRFLDFNSHYIHRPSFSLLAHKHLNNTIGLLIQANALQFEMSDRYQRGNGQPDIGARNFARSLNFRTNLYDLGFAVTFSPNNGHILSKDAFFYPSVSLGLGVSAFSVKGDLYDEAGNPYNYNTAADVNDGVFETNLRDLNTERNKRYSTVAPYLNLGLALNFRVSDRFRIVLQSDIKYSGSDYLDDVSTTYKTSYPSPQAAYAARPGYNTVDPATLARGDNNGIQDMYINNRFVVLYRLGNTKKSSAFKAPVIYSIARTDTSSSGRLQRYYRRNDTIPAKSDSMALVATLTVKDSLLRDSTLKTLNRFGNDSIDRSAVNSKLSSIETQLQDIKTVLRNQTLIAGYRHLQYQLDSVNRLSNVLNNKRPFTTTDRLQQRVYVLQQDSIRNEMQTLLWMSQYPAKGLDSAMLYFDPSTGGVPFRNNEFGIANRRVVSDTVYADTISAENINLRRASSDSSYKTQINRRLHTSERVQRLTDSIERLSRLADSIEDVRGRIDSIQSSANGDSIETIGRLRLERLQKRLDSLEGIDRAVVIERREAERTNQAELERTLVKPATEARDSANSKLPENDSTERLRVQESENLDVARGDSLQIRLKENTQSLARLQTGLKASRDSAAYYRRSLYALNLDAGDTIVEKKKWYQRIIPASRKRREAEEETSQARAYRDQEAYFDAQTKVMNRDIERLQRDNRDLANDYDRIRRQQNNRVVNRTPSLVVQTDDNNASSREIRQLRNEISDLRTRLTPPSTIQPDTIQARPAVLTPVSAGQDSTQLVALRSDLAKMRRELDSLRKRPPPVASVSTPVTAAPAPAEFDVASFPVISVYFGMNTATLPSTQADKISPLVSVMKKNKRAKVQLTGFTDPVGNVAVNKALAKKRIEHVKSILIDKFGLPESQIALVEPEIPTIKGVKKANPLDRRVDLKLR